MTCALGMSLSSGVEWGGGGCAMCGYHVDLQYIFTRTICPTTVTYKYQKHPRLIHIIGKGIPVKDNGGP
jgi:hypothetical protein